MNDKSVLFSFDVYIYIYITRIARANVQADNAYARLDPTALNLADLANRTENGVVGRALISFTLLPRTSVWHFFESEESRSLFRDQLIGNRIKKKMPSAVR